jgi:hypothetical protein
MPTPNDEITLLQREYLEHPNGEYLKDELAFAVARRIVKYDDPMLLDHMPAWVGDMVREMCDIYKEHGTYRIISNVGEADHSDMVARLSELMAGAK